MKYELIPTKFFLEQLNELNTTSIRRLREKLELIKINPFRYKRIHKYDLLLFRIRFSDKQKEKRVIYFVYGSFIKILCILDRDKNYKDLKKYLKKLGY